MPGALFAAPTPPPRPQDLLAGFDDTCTFLWIAGGAGKLSDRARDLFREGLVLLTPDELITQYPVRSLW